MIRDRADRLVFVFCLLFICLGCLWVGEMGIQNDEALFSAGIYPPSFDWSMVMTYVGTLKSFLYTCRSFASGGHRRLRPEYRS